MLLDALKCGVNKDEDDDANKGGRGGGGGVDNETPGPGPPPPITLQQEIDDIVRRLDILQGNTPEVSPDNTQAQNFKIGKLEKEKVNFQTYQKELFIRGNQA